MISSDSPISREREDRLGRSSFAKALAKAAIDFDGVDSFVVGIHGKWGAGKSSVLNLIAEELARSSEDQSQTVDVVRFNPWNFADQNQLVLQFLRQFAGHLRQSNKNSKSEKIKSLLENLNRYSAALGPPLEAVPIPGFKFFGLVRSGISTVTKAVSGEQDVDSLFATVGRQLQEIGRKTVVFIDDIDRLSENEIRQVFQLVKLTARFPNVVYILAFDRSAVADALSGEKTSGEEYLEKIVQVSFDLPPISEATMTLMVDDAIRNLVTAYPSASFDNHRYGQLFHSGLRASFQSLRDVRRFINGLEFGFGMIASEVNGVDFVGVEALRVFYPKVFHAIRQNKALVAGNIDPIDSHAGSEQFKARVDATFRLADANIDDCKELVLELFPKLAYAYAKTSYGHNAETEWEKSYRVCTTRYFDFYFQLVVPEGEVSVAEIDKTVESARVQEELTSNLGQYIETNRVRPAFESFRRSVNSIPRAYLSNVLGSLLEVGDRVKHLGSMMTGPLPEFLYVSWTIFDVLNLLAAHYRFAVFEQQCRITDGVGTCFDVLANIEEINGKDSEKYKEFDKASLQALRELLVARVKQLASEGKLLDKDLLPSIIVSWKRWGIEAEARAYVYGVISNPKDLIRFLNKFIFQTTSIGLTDKVARVENKLSMSGIAGIVDISAVVSQVGALDLSALSGQEREIVELAREWLTKFRTSGLTPERFDARRGFDD